MFFNHRVYQLRLGGQQGGELRILGCELRGDTRASFAGGEDRFIEGSRHVKGISR